MGWSPAGWHGRVWSSCRSSWSGTASPCAAALCWNHNAACNAVSRACASLLESQLGSLAKRGECQVPSYTAHRPMLFWGSWLAKVAKLSEPPGQWWRLTFLSDLYCLFSSSEKLILCWTCLRKVLGFLDEWGVAYAVGKVLGSRGLCARGAVHVSHGWQLGCSFLSPFFLHPPEALISALGWLHSCKDKVPYLCRHLLALIRHELLFLFNLALFWTL